MWVEMDHWLLWGSVMRARLVAVELVGGLDDGSGAEGDCLGVDDVAVGDAEMDEAAGGRELGRQGVGEHEGGAVDFDLGVADAALGKGIRTRV